MHMYRHKKLNSNFTHKSRNKTIKLAIIVLLMGSIHSPVSDNCYSLHTQLDPTPQMNSTLCICTLKLSPYKPALQHKAKFRT
jgi:hypothetical protein